MDEDWEFDSTPVREMLHQLITDWYGPRCVDFDPSCPVCVKWAAFDTIFMSEFE